MTRSHADGVEIETLRRLVLDAMPLYRSYLDYSGGVPMIDQSTPAGRIVTAALRLAAERPWAQVSLRDIADAAMMSLSDLRKEMGSKPQIIAKFIRAIDDEVTSRMGRAQAAQATGAQRDRLFEVLMSRFDAMAPYKSALRSILKDLGGEPMILRASLASQAWMLEEAGISTDGSTGRLKVAGLMSVYGSVFRVWLEDDDPSLSRTMAALDRRLKRGEQTMSSVDDAVAGMRRMGEQVREMFGRLRPTGDGAASAAGTPQPGPAASPTQPAGFGAPTSPPDRPSPGFF